MHDWLRHGLSLSRCFATILPKIEFFRGFPMTTTRLQPAHKTLTVNGLRIHYLEWGATNAPPVICVHGYTSSAEAFNALARRLQHRVRIIAPHVRGHGESGWSPDHVYGLDRFSGDVVRIVEHLGRPPVLIGASLGGNAALAALGHYPELALGLVLVDVSPFLQPAGASRIRAFMTARAEAGFGSLEEVADAVAAYLPHRRRPRNLDGLRKNLRHADGRWYWHWDPAFLREPTDQPVQRDPVIDSARLGAAATSLRVPTLLVRGGESDVLSEQDAVRFLELVPHAEFATVAGAHHMVAGDDNAVFEEVLGDFLERRIRSRLRLLAGRPAP
jgi:pimeloyl-ACP methyl ester carboxylesterase